MKKKYFIVFISLFFGLNSSFAQDIRFGLTAGGNTCGLFGPDKPTQYDKEFGFSGGFFIDSRFAEHMSTQIEANFTRYNFNFSEKIDIIEDAYLNIIEKNDYISIPVMLKYKRGYEFIFYYISAGGQASVLLNHKREVTATSRGLVINSDSYYNYSHNWYDYGFKASVGFQYKPITISLNYYTSMRNLYKKDEAREMRYKVASLELSYQFNYRDAYPYGRKTGLSGLKYKIKHLFK